VLHRGNDGAVFATGAAADDLRVEKSPIFYGDEGVTQFCAVRGYFQPR
jgi:hypothetical protein